MACRRSCVELLKMAGEAADALFAMDLPTPLGVVHSLAQGIDATLQRCVQAWRRVHRLGCLLHAHYLMAAHGSLQDLGHVPAVARRPLQAQRCKPSRGIR